MRNKLLYLTTFLLGSGVASAHPPIPADIAEKVYGLLQTAGAKGDITLRAESVYCQHFSAGDVQVYKCDLQLNGQRDPYHLYQDDAKYMHTFLTALTRQSRHAFAQVVSCDRIPAYGCTVIP